MEDTETKKPQEQGGGGGASTDLWSVWSSVKSAAQTVVEIYKEDLQEFAGAVVQDTEEAIQEVQKEIKSGPGLMSTLESVIVGETKERAADGSVVPRSRMEAKLIELRKDVGTYCTQPESADEYEEFCAGITLEQIEEEATTLLQDSTVGTHYAKLVPVVVSYDDFWKRYLYRAEKLQKREEERQLLIQEASEAVSCTAEELTWDVELDDVDAGNMENSWKDDVVSELQDVSWTPIKALDDAKQPPQQMQPQQQEKDANGGSDMLDTTGEDSIIAGWGEELQLPDEEPAVAVAEPEEDADWAGWE